MEFREYDRNIANKKKLDLEKREIIGGGINAKRYLLCRCVNALDGGNTLIFYGGYIIRTKKYNITLEERIHENYPLNNGDSVRSIMLMVISGWIAL